jgi:hypothetical protein
MTLRCLRGHEWEPDLTRIPATRSTPEERTIAASDERCEECGLYGYEAGDEPEYDELKRELRLCPACDTIWDTQTGLPFDIDLEPEIEVCPGCGKREAA